MCESTRQGPTGDLQHVLMVGFRTKEVEAMVAEGIPVTAVLHVPERGEGTTLARVEHLSYYAAASCQIFVTQRRDFDQELRRALYAKAIHLFRRHYSRSSYARSRTLRSWVHLDNLFHIAANFYFDLLKRHDVSDVVFCDFPHEGSSIILYHLCRLLGVNTVIMMQSLFPSRIWITREIEDFGSFNTVLGGHEPLLLPAEPTVPFYMKRTKPLQRFAAAMPVVSREAVKLTMKALTLQMLYNQNGWERNRNRFVTAVDKLSTGHPSSKDEVDVKLDVPFVYFPLHLQPEMTTDTWGFAYGDQLLALEELSAALESGVQIYVKENPKQTRFMREESFFQRLRTIPNVHYIDPGLSSFELTRKCICVATISGTVGWEALLMGRPVIHFGVAWFSALPGAFRWVGAATVKQALNFKGTRDDLADAFARLAQKSYPGVIHGEYAAIVEGYDRTRHGGQAIASVAAVLREGEKG